MGAAVCVAKRGRYPFTLSNVYGFLDPARGEVLSATGSSMGGSSSGSSSTAGGSSSTGSLFDLGGVAKLLAAVALLRLLQVRYDDVAVEGG